MNQQKVGQFLKELRKEKDLTQEQFAELLGVSNRSISRWENGVTMPDFDLLIQIAKYFNVEIGEILDGERKGDDMDNKTAETMLKVADYNNTEKMIFSKRLCYMFIVGLISLFVYVLIDNLEFPETPFYGFISGLSIGIVFGDLLLGVLVSSRYMTKIRAVKLRLLNRIKK